MKSQGKNRIFFLSIKVGLLAFLLFLIPNTSEGITDYSPTLIDLTNQTRIAFGLSPLRINEQLRAAAQLKLNHMFDNNYFDHIAPDSKSPWHFLEKAGYLYQKAGENLAMDYVDLNDAHDAWMQSPSHRQLILDSEYEEIGLAYQKGEINGQKTILVVALFGDPE